MENPGLTAVGTLGWGRRWVWRVEDRAAQGFAWPPSALTEVNVPLMGPEQGRNNCFANKHLVDLFPPFSSHSSFPSLNKTRPGFT